MQAAIESAAQYVLLEMYLMASGSVADRFIDALVRATARGVRACVLLDGFGSLGLNARDRRRLAAAGVELRWFNALGWRKRLANFLRDHRKLLLVDGRVGFVGGAGLTDDFERTDRPGTPWRDLMVEISGPVVADWQEAFGKTWQGHRGAVQLPAAPARIAPVNGAAGRLVASAGWHRAELANSVVHRIGTARERVWVMSAYFVVSRRIRKALRAAVRRGADVRLLVPGPHTDHPLVRHAARRFFGKLLCNGVRIFEFQPRVLHAKMIVCDDWVSIGSSNFDRWSFKWNLEANQEIEHRPFASRAAAVFESDCLQSVELDARAWSRRARLDRVNEHLAGALDRWLDRWRRPKQR